MIQNLKNQINSLGVNPNKESGSAGKEISAS
jgi:hypothetical protein